MKKQKIIIASFVLFICCISIVIYLLRGKIYQTLYLLKLVPLPETFTELYFEHHLSLPSSVSLNQPQTFSFTIHNLEAKNITYLYEVYIDTNGQKQLLEAKPVNIRDNGSMTISENFTIATPSARSTVVVNLRNKNQQIDFWIETNPSPTGIPTISLTPSTSPKKAVIKRK